MPKGDGFSTGFTPPWAHSFQPVWFLILTPPRETGEPLISWTNNRTEAEAHADAWGGVVVEAPVVYWPVGLCAFGHRDRAESVGDQIGMCPQGHPVKLGPGDGG